MKANPTRSSFLVFTKSNWKWVIIPAADTKCPRMALKYITPKKPWASGLNVVRYITHARRSKLQFMWFALPAVSPTKLPFYVSARRCDQKESYCDNRRRRRSWYMESGETQVFRSISRHQLFSCQDHGTFELLATPSLFVNTPVFGLKNFHDFAFIINLQIETFACKHLKSFTRRFAMVDTLV